jgi:hypothetical protein
LRDKFVADPANGLKKDGMTRIALDFLTKFRNAVVNRAVSRALPLWPGRADELLARNHDPGSTYQELEHFELPERDLDWPADAIEFHRSEIQGHLPELRHLTDFSALKI